MPRLTLATLILIATSPLAFAGISLPTPGPLLGVVAGPWGLAATAIGYGAYMLYKAKH